MPQGFQVFSENGNVSIDISANLTRILGSFMANTRTGRRSIPVDNQEKPFAYFVPSQAPSFGCNFSLWLEGNNVCWRYGTIPAGSPYQEMPVGSVKVYYGVR